jgi:hypothetical protein
MILFLGLRAGEPEELYHRTLSLKARADTGCKRKLPNDGHRLSASRKVTIKRVAIATCWGAALMGPAQAYLSVRDPVDEGEPIDAEDKDAVFIGLLRHHIANLVAPLGHAELAGALRRLTRERSEHGLQRDVASVRALLNAAPVREVDGASAIDGLVGGIVTRAGPLTDATAAPADQDVLASLNLRPVFVGIERDLIDAAIKGEAKTVCDRLAAAAKHDEFARPDRAGGWVIPLGAGRRIIGSA